MYLNKLQIKNFKNLNSCIFDFKKGSNTIIGENDSGKSNAITALRILLDNSFFYNTKRLKEKDFSETLKNWKGHWIIISACFNDISTEEQSNEICKDIIPEIENEYFLKSIIRCKENNFGTITLFIRPNKRIRMRLFEACDTDEFKEIRESITLDDYEFFYTSKSQEIFANSENYKKIVGDLENNKCTNPEEEDSSILGNKIDILEVWQYISVVFIDAIRDVESELYKSKNPVRRMIDTIQSQIKNDDKISLITKIKDLNTTLSKIPQIADIGYSINNKLRETIGMVYSPNIKLESQIKDDIPSLSKFLTVSPSNSKDLDYLGLGHLNIIFIALKLVEFEYNKNREVLNIMIIEEPEAHLHTHIQKTLFYNLDVENKYTQILMTTHSVHLSEISDISSLNILKCKKDYSIVMQPTNKLDGFAKEVLKAKDISQIKILERYLDSKRSVLLFSKGVILVEGDGEEILIPNMIKKVLGVSLDELGIGIINIGSVAFENIACIFSENRLQEYCAIITDKDTNILNSKKTSIKAEKLGKNRVERLTKIFKNNKYVEMFYANYTFEYDFCEYQNNLTYIEKIIDLHYLQKNTKSKHKLNLCGNINDKYDSILTIAESIGKGWYSTLLAEFIDYKTIIPEYILKSIAFATQEIMTPLIQLKMINYYLEQIEQDDSVSLLKQRIKELKTDEDIEKFIKEICIKYSEEVVTKFVIECAKYE